MNRIRNSAVRRIARPDRNILIIAGLLAVLAGSEALLHSLHLEHRAHYQRAWQELALLHDNRDWLKQLVLDRSGPAGSDSLLSLTNRLLEQHELHSSAITPNSDDSMTLSFDAIEYVRLMNWLQSIEQQRLRIVDISMVQTDTPGLITVRLSLVGRAQS